MAASKKSPSKSVTSGGKGARKTAAKKKRSKSGKSVKPNFSTFIYRVLKETHPTIGITKKSMGIMNDFVLDMLDKIASEAKRDLEFSKRGEKTLREWHLNTATKLVLSGELGKHGISEGTKAVRNFKANSKK